MSNATHYCLNVLILHSSTAYQSNCLQLELLIDYELLNPFCFDALSSLGLPRILAQYKYFIHHILLLLLLLQRDNLYNINNSCKKEHLLTNHMMNAIVKTV